MKTVYVNGAIVNLNNVKPDAPLTPDSVKSALICACGNIYKAALVHDNETGYRVTGGGSIHKLTAEGQFDCGIGE